MNKLILVLVITTVIAVFYILNNKKTTTIIQRSESKRIDYEMMENDEGSVIVTVTPTKLIFGQDPRFSIEFNTHSVDLSFDITKISKLIDDKGNIYTVAVWDGSPPEGHHRRGVLTFQEPLKDAKTIELVLKDISNIPERRFKWEL